MKFIVGGLMALSVIAATPAVGVAQTAVQAGEWRTVAPENLLVIDTSKGRILVELAPFAAPNHVERIRTLADQGFYDGHKFHRVIDAFMAQTGDPLGTGAGGSQLPDLTAEFGFRRGRDSGFVPVIPGAAPEGFIGSLPVMSQPDAQMFVTADMRTAANAEFCAGAAAMARGQSPNSANSQFFLMRETRVNMNGHYTVWGQVVSGQDVVRSLKHGLDTMDGAVTQDPDIMTHVRTAASLPAAQRPTVRVLDPHSARFTALVEQARAARGNQFSICDIVLPVEVSGG